MLEIITIVSLLIFVLVLDTYTKKLQVAEKARLGLARAKAVDYFDGRSIQTSTTNLYC